MTLMLRFGAARGGNPDVCVADGFLPLRGWGVFWPQMDTDHTDSWFVALRGGESGRLWESCFGPPMDAD